MSSSARRVARRGVGRALMLDMHRVHRVVAACRTSIGRRGLRHGVLPTLVPQAMLRRLQPSFVLDVGANRGQFVLDALICAPGAQLHAVEPLDQAHRVLTKLTKRYDLVRTSNCALGSMAGSGTLFVSTADDSSSLLPIGVMQQLIYPNTGPATSVTVEVDTVDHLLADFAIPERSLLKLDVQGYELAVLRGATRTLPEFEWVYSEVSFVPLYDGQPLAAEIIDHLRGHGFRLTDLSKLERYGGRTIQVDMLFERRRKRP